MLKNSILYTLIMNDKVGRYILAALLALAILVPILNIVMPEDSFLHVPTYTVSLLGKYLCYALLALALDLVWGYCGILSLGHGAFFALGGYAMGMYLMRQIGDRGVYGNAELPDFMVFLNWDSLPWYWLGFDSFTFAMIMVIVVPGLLAFVFGWLAFRSRVTGVYLSIITQALTFALMQAFFLNDFGFGGNNGLTDFKEILGFDIQSDGTRLTLFVLSAVSVILAYLACRFITTSKFGRVLVSIRDAESRTRFLGYRVEHYKLLVFIFSAMLAGIAGALFVPQVGIINPGEFSPINSIEIVIWVALGGRGTLYGAVIGALVVNYAKTYFTGAFPEIWLFMLGGLFVISTTYLPRGIVGVAESLMGKRKARSTHGSDDSPDQSDADNDKNIGEVKS
ncbi:urea ABC transporter permease subunit UrtC [Teredinibacter waterburyi]|uniref:urea ABC transporter permease subunit UrtC n=1 Tax=Teredinibacter waterburyi TaxID=1500538 RepID=UPI00165EDAE4|nr:urea ABC transporter permease subunit UrtC [Teredinibacter waterburyi]